MPRRLTSVRLAALLGLALVAGVAPAHDDDDHERARAAVQAGQALPLRSVLERLARSHPGQVLDVELEAAEAHDGPASPPWIYKIKLLQPDGRLLKLKVDARSGAVLAERRRAVGHGHPR